MFILNIIPILLLIVTTNAIGLPDDIAYNRSRLERATDEEFSTAIKQMEMISRVTNGIALQQGLSKGSITNEELISELLNLRDVEPSDIMHLDTEEFKKLVEGIHKLSEIIPTTKSSDPIKIRLDTLNSFVNKPIDVEKVEEPGPEFLKAVTTLKKSTLDWKQIEGFAGRLKDFHGKATIVANFPKIGNKIPADTVDDFLHAIGKVMRQIDLSPFKAELAGDSISKAKEKLKDFPKVVKTVNDFANVEKELSYKSKTDDPIIKSLEKSMNVLATVLEQMWNDHEIIRILEKLYILRRHRSGNQDSKLIPAFSRDTSELGLISNDLKDSWVQAEVNGQASILEKAFQPFSALKEKTEKVDGSIGTSTDASFTEINLVLSQIEYLSQFSQISGLSSETLVKVLKSSDEAKKYLPSNRKTIETLYQNMIQLSKHVTSIKEVFKIWEKLVKPKNKLTELKTLATLTDDSKAVEVLKKMQQNANFKDALKTVEDAIEHIKIAELDFKKTVESVVSDYNKMAPFVKQANEFLKTIEPMRQLSKLSNPTSVFKNIETIKDAITNKEFGEKVNIDPVIVSIENTKSALKELDDSINSIKSAKGSEIERLVGATDASETARNIGSATKAVSSMNQFFYLDTSKLKAEIEKLRQGLSVQASIEKKNTVKALASLEIQIQNFKHEIESFKGSVQPITSSKLSDYSEIFEKAKSVKGITRDFFALSVLVGELKEAYPAPGDKQIIDEIKDLLVTMDKLCLKYSKYQTVFDGSKNTLNNIDLLFTNLKVSNVAPPAKQTKTTPQIPVFKYDDIPTGKKVKNVILMSEFIRNWIIGGSIVYAVAMTLYLCYTYKFNPFQRKNKKGRESDEKKVEEAREKNMKKADEVQGTTITPAPLSAGKTPAATITPTPLSASKTATPTPKKT
ncbi:hypothetical protein CAEBREN_08486 [Caenorhabditis brenneri]|uniref:Domain of unknown function WSN domain-containing protein n=1 Tax=Caenorhabditis brenneri TaxID=135651 RepID=G0MJU8_CAEBE|nr:hypothetical protein CAEBREN_08486 [Caenorhabditis brenneri]